MIIVDLIFVVVGIIFVIYKLAKEGVFNMSSGKVITEEDDERTTDEIMRAFRDCKYENINRDTVKRILVKNPTGPIRHGEYSKKSIPVPLWYNYMCTKESLDINQLSKEELEKKIGMPIGDIPLPKGVPLGEAIFRREVCVKDYILKKDGLRYTTFQQVLFELSDYRKEVNEFIDNFTRTNTS